MKRIRILYIEDDDGQRVSLTRRLRARGFVVAVARTGRDGLSLFKKREFTAILCDLNMPGMGGREVLARVRKKNAAIPFILLSAHGTVSLAVRAIKEGADDFILKPPHINEIVLTISRALETRRLRDQLEEYSQRLERMVADRTADLEFANRQLSALNKVSNRFSKIYDEDKLFDIMPRLLTRSLDFDRAYLLFPGDGTFYVRSWCPGTGDKRQVESNVKVFNSGGVKIPPQIAESYRRQETIFIPDPAKDRRWPRRPGFMTEPQSIVIAPVKAKGGPVGVILGSIQNSGRAVGKQDIDRFEMYTNMSGLALDNIRSYKSMEQKVQERTESLRRANDDLRGKARLLKLKAGELEKSRVEIARANLDLLAAQEELQEKNIELEGLLKELSASRDKLQTIIDASPDLLILVDGEGIVQAVNRRTMDYFGLDPGAVIGSGFDEFNESIKGRFEDPEKYADLLGRLERKADDPEKIELSELFERGIRVKSKEPLALSITSLCVFDESGAEIGRVWSYYNVAKLEEADQRVHAIVQASPIPTIISRIDDGEVLFVNEELASLIGFSPEELVGGHTTEFYYDPQERNRIVEMLRERGTLKAFETRLRRRDGGIIWTILSLVITEIAGEKVILGGIYDISEQKRVEETLRVSEERFRSLVENAQEIIYSLTPEGEFIYISPKATEIMGYEVGELIGKPLFPLLHPDDAKDSTRWFRSGFENHELSGRGYEFRMRHKDGSVRWFTTHASQIRDESGNVIELIGVAHDITMIRKALEDLEEANRHIQETQAQLAQSEKMASLGMLVAGIAHEINTPIGAVNSMHDTLVRSVARLKAAIGERLGPEGGVPPEIGAALDIIDDSNAVIRKGAERVINIVRRLRSFARLDEAKLKTVDIHEGLEDTLILAHHELKHSVTVVKNYGNVPPVPVFPGQLNQVFLNILVNAKQAIRDKGTITISTFVRGGKVHIVFEDSGAGIAGEDLDRIFDPGFTTKGVGVGTGLGLSICYQILQDHHGEIRVESEVGKGTTFTVVLPMNLDKILEENA